jgi:hypothetical protein
MKAIFFFIFSSLICQISWAQRTVPGLKDKQVQLELLKQTSKLDSLVFADKANYRYDDMILNGFGFKKKKVYSMKLLFEKVDVEPYTIRLVDVKKKKCKDKAQINMLKKLEIGKIRTISTDSLQIKAKLGDDVINLADGSSYTLLFIDQKRDTVYLKQCNSPVNYQKQYATKDRAFFITLFDALQKK